MIGSIASVATSYALTFTESIEPEQPLDGFLRGVADRLRVGLEHPLDQAAFVAVACKRPSLTLRNHPASQIGEQRPELLLGQQIRRRLTQSGLHDSKRKLFGGSGVIFGGE